MELARNKWLSLGVLTGVTQATSFVPVYRGLTDKLAKLLPLELTERSDRPTRVRVERRALCFQFPDLTNSLPFRA